VIVALEVVGALVVLVVLAMVALRIRKLRRDEIRALSKPVERRLMAPPPSPYAPSKGFRLLDAEGAPLIRPPVERPRLDPARHYGFSELSTPNDEVVNSSLRHNDDWFLSRSSNRSTLSIVLRRLVVLVVIALVVVVLATYYVNHHDTKPTHHNSTTPTTSVTTTTAPPLLVTSASGDEAIYDVSLARYRVTVTATGGSTSAVYDVGPTNTLVWRGTIEEGHDESLVVSGDSRITLGSPSNASVAVAGRSVHFPSPLPPTLAVVVRSSVKSRS
jgi:hypothetical protein